MLWLVGWAKAAEAPHLAGLVPSVVHAVYIAIFLRADCVGKAELAPHT
jgi:hypothetical protein